AFEDPDIIRVDDSVDPVRDLEVITEELWLKDMHNENLEEMIPSPCKVSESIYSVQQIANEYNMEQTNAYSVEDDSSVQERNCLSPVRYPLLEVNETGLECFKGLSTVEKFNLLIEKIEGQHWTQNNNLTGGGKGRL
ncbi:hypothetical protein IFM89_002329, partial [Coptis chinensis]